MLGAALLLPGNAEIAQRLHTVSSNSVPFLFLGQMWAEDDVALVTVVKC